MDLHNFAMNAWHALRMRITHRRRIISVAAIAVVVVATALVVLRQVIGSGCFDRAAVDQVVAQLPPPPTDPNAFALIDVPDKIGSCRILEADGVNGGYIFYGNNIHLDFDDHGWGYFPAGPTADLGNGNWEGPRFTHIEGTWYTWTASW
jgi:hypothetical protein